MNLFVRRVGGWLSRIADRVTCFLMGHTPRRRPDYVYCAACGYLHQRGEKD